MKRFLTSLFSAPRSPARPAIRQTRKPRVQLSVEAMEERMVPTARLAPPSLPANPFLAARAPARAPAPQTHALQLSVIRKPISLGDLYGPPNLAHDSFYLQGVDSTGHSYFVGWLNISSEDANGNFSGSLSLSPANGTAGRLAITGQVSRLNSSVLGWSSYNFSFQTDPAHGISYSGWVTANGDGTFALDGQMSGLMRSFLCVHGSQDVPIA
jgi:hypothetical protein